MKSLWKKAKGNDHGNNGNNTKSNEKPQTPGKTTNKGGSHSKSPPTGSFIDDPNELLMSCAKRQLNKEDPDVRWGTILVNILKETKQLEAVNSDRDEIQSKLKQYSTTDLISLRKKLTGNLQIDG